MDSDADQHPVRDEGDRSVTEFLQAAVERRPCADAELLEAVYNELRAIAGAFLKFQAPGQALEPTALVHEAYLKLAGSDGKGIEGRAHFVSVAATAMRQVIVDHARHHNAQKRGGGAKRLTLSGLVLGDGASDVDALHVHEALNRLAELDPRQARVVELRFFAGLSVVQAAAVLGVSERTVEFDWRFARAWLRRELEGNHG